MHHPRVNQANPTVFSVTVRTIGYATELTVHDGPPPPLPSTAEHLYVREDHGQVNLDDCDGSARFATHALADCTMDRTAVITLHGADRLAVRAQRACFCVLGKWAHRLTPRQEAAVKRALVAIATEDSRHPAAPAPSGRSRASDMPAAAAAPDDSGVDAAGTPGARLRAHAEFAADAGDGSCRAGGGNTSSIPSGVPIATPRAAVPCLRHRSWCEGDLSLRVAENPALLAMVQAWSNIEPVVRDVFDAIYNNDNNVHAVFTKQTQIQTVVFPVAERYDAFELYRHLRGWLRTFVAEKVAEPLSSIDANAPGGIEALAVAMAEHHRKYEQFTRFGKGAFSHLGRSKRIARSGTLTIEQIFAQAFHEAVYAPVMATLSRAAFARIDARRNGYDNDVDLAALKAAIRAATDVGAATQVGEEKKSSVGVYRNDFERAYVGWLRELYCVRAAAEFSSPSTYLEWVEGRLDLELALADAVLLRRSVELVRDAVKEELINTFAQPILAHPDYGCDALLKAWKTTDVARMFRLTKHDEDSFFDMAHIMQRRIEAELSELHAQLRATGSATVDKHLCFARDIGELNVKYDRLIQDHFEHSSRFHDSCASAFDDGLTAAALRGAVLALVDAWRRGTGSEAVDTPVLRAAVRVFIDVDTAAAASRGALPELSAADLLIYTGEFEDGYLDSLRDWCKARRRCLESQVPPHAYLKRALSTQATELALARDILHPSSVERVRHVAEEELLSPYFVAIVDHAADGCGALLDRRDVGALTEMHQLLSIEQWHKAHRLMGAALQSRIEAAVAELIQQFNNTMSDGRLLSLERPLVEGIVELNEKYGRLIHAHFDGGIFFDFRKKAFTVALAQAKLTRTDPKPGGGEATEQKGPKCDERRCRRRRRASARCLRRSATP